jgi:hypothetical protein
MGEARAARYLLDGRVHEPRVKELATDAALLALPAARARLDTARRRPGG